MQLPLEHYRFYWRSPGKALVKRQREVTQVAQQSLPEMLSMLARGVKIEVLSGPVSKTASDARIQTRLPPNNRTHLRTEMELGGSLHRLPALTLYLLHPKKRRSGSPTGSCQSAAAVFTR